MRSACKLIVLVFAAFVGGCADGNVGSLLPNIGGQTFPPDRTVWQTASLPVRAAHARALHTMLEQGDGGSANWSADGANGRMQVDRFGPIEETFCAVFTDSITSGGASTTVRDFACWGEGWTYVRDPVALPVLNPAFEESSKVYTVKRGGTLRAVARRTKTRLSDLQFLNPGHPKRLAPGTTVLLP